MKHLTLIACGLLATIVYAENTAEARKAAAAEREKARAELLQIQDSLRREREARYGSSGRLLNDKTRTHAVELTETEKAFHLDSFAGYKFGTVMNKEVALNGKLVSPFRAFSSVQLIVSTFEHRLCGVHLYGNISDWNAQSITNEVNFLRKMLSSQYGIKTWNTDKGILSPHGRLFFKFKNEKVSISLSADSRINLYVENLQVKNQDAYRRECAKKSVTFPDSDAFSKLEQISTNVRTQTIITGQSITNDIPVKCANFINSGVTAGSKNCLAKETYVFPRNDDDSISLLILTRTHVAADGEHVGLYFRKITITNDGRIKEIGPETQAVSVYTDQG